MQVQPDIVDIGFAASGESQFFIDFFVKLDKDRIDDIVFVAEVVIQIAGRDIHFFGNDGGRDIGFAKFIKQFKR